jgi:hypothetical protein
MFCQHSSPRHFGGPGNEIRTVSAEPTHPHQRIRPEAPLHSFPAAKVAALTLAENQLGDRAHVRAFGYGLWQICDGTLRGARTISKEANSVENALRASLFPKSGEIASDWYRTAFPSRYVLPFAKRLQKQVLARFVDSGNELAAELKVEKGSEAA